MKVIGYILITPLLWMFCIPFVAILFPKTKKDGAESSLAIISFIIVCAIWGVMILSGSI